MPPTEEMLEKAADCLDDTDVQQFKVTPTEIIPGQVATVGWKTSSPGGCTVALELNGTGVQRAGSKQVSPTNTTTYKLAGRMFGLYKQFGTISLVVNTSACTTVTVPEEVVRNLVRNAVRTTLGDVPVHERSPADVEIDAAGIRISIKLKVEVPNFFNPDLNIRMTIRAAVEEGRPRAYFTQYSASVNWPWWVTGITLGITEFIENILEDKIEAQTRPKILSAIQAQLEQAVGNLPPNRRLTSVETAPDQLRIMICPAA